MSQDICASHILVEHEHEAQDILKKLKEGKSFEDLDRRRIVKTVTISS